MEMVRWSSGTSICFIAPSLLTMLCSEEMQLAPGTEAYANIPLVINALGVVLGRVKDSKAAAKTFSSKSKANELPRVEDDIFGNGEENNDSDDDNARSLVSLPIPQRVPYRIVEHHGPSRPQVLHGELDSLIAFASDDLPEIALDNEAQPTRLQGTYRQQHHQDQQEEDEHLRFRQPEHQHRDQKHQEAHAAYYEESSQRYRVAHRGEMGGHQYRELVINTANTRKDGSQPPVKAMGLSEQKTLAGPVLPITKARIPSLPSSRLQVNRVPVSSSNFYHTVTRAPSNRAPPPTHPANRIPPPGQRFAKGKEKAGVHSAESNFSSHIRQDQSDESHRFVRQRLVRDGQAGPSREVYLTREEEEQRSRGFAADAYTTAIYEDDEN